MIKESPHQTPLTVSQTVHLTSIQKKKNGSVPLGGVEGRGARTGDGGRGEGLVPLVFACKKKQGRAASESTESVRCTESAQWP